MIRTTWIVSAALLSCLFIGGVRAQDACVIEAVAGGSPANTEEGRPALEAELWSPAYMRQGPDGLLYFVETGRRRIRRVDADGRIETLAGNGELRAAGDGSAGSASIASVTDLEIDAEGTLYWLETHFGVVSIRRLRPGGTVETVAGGSVLGVSGDGVPAVDAGISSTRDFTVAPDGTIYLAYPGTSLEFDAQVRRVSTDGRIETVAGGDGAESFVFDQPVAARDARLGRVQQVVALNDGSVMIRQEAEGAPLLRLRLDGQAEPVLTRVSPFGSDAGRLVPFTLRRTLRFDGAGRIHWLQRGDVMRVGDDLTAETIWSTPSGEPDVTNLWVTADGALWTLRGGQIVQLVGDGEMQPAAGAGWGSLTGGDGGAAFEASLQPNVVAAGPNGEVYVTDSFTRRVRVVRNGVISNYAGTGRVGETTDGQAATEAGIDSVGDMGVDAAGNLYVVSAQAVWRVSPDGAIIRYAGTGLTCSNDADDACGDGGPAAAGSLGAFLRMAVAPDGTLYLHHRRTDLAVGIENVLRRVSPEGIIETLDVELPVGTLRRMAVDSEGRLRYFDRRSSGFGWRLGDAGFEAVPGPVLFGGPVAAAPDGVMYTESWSRSILRVLPDGTTDTIVPEVFENLWSSGEGGPAGEAIVGSVRSLAVSPQGDLLIGDSVTDHVWRIRNVAGCPETGETTPGIVSAAGPTGAAPSGLFSMFGEDLGPEEGVAASPDGAGEYPLELAGTEVWIGGRRAPLLFVSAGQINGVAPNSTEMTEATRFALGTQPGVRPSIRVRRNGETRPASSVIMGRSAPALFALGPEQAAALNQDGTVNGPLNPAAPGSVLVLFGTGAGDMDPLPETGRVVTGTPLPLATQEVTAELFGFDAPVLYAGAAPGLVSGVVQVNVRVPEDLPRLGAVGIEIRIGERTNAFQRLTVVVGR